MGKLLDRRGRPFAVTGRTLPNDNRAAVKLSNQKKTYQGERTEFGCEVTVDGNRLPLRSDLSGSRTTTFDWGAIGSRQLSLALLSDFLGDDEQAIRLQDAFEQQVVAQLPRDSWKLTDAELAAALVPLGWKPIPTPVAETAHHAEVRQAAPPAESAGSQEKAVAPTADWPVALALVTIELDHETIAKLAYEIWEANGRSDGHDLDDWLKAEAYLASAQTRAEL
jgi:hypothetical protein